MTDSCGTYCDEMDHRLLRAKHKLERKPLVHTGGDVTRLYVCSHCLKEGRGDGCGLTGNGDQFICD